MPLIFKTVFKFLKKLFFEPNFENFLTLEKLIIEEKARAESNLVENGNAYAVSKARSFISPVYDITEKISNIDYLLFLRNLEKRITEGEIKKISEELLLVHKHLLGSKKVINVSCKKDYHSKVREFIEELCAKFTFDDIKPTYKFNPQKGNKIAYVISSEVNFVAEAFSTADTKHGGYLFAVTKELNAGYLWQKIRSEGGAYGASTQITMNDMVFSTYSYRDPNIAKTYEAFSGIGEYLATFKPQEKEFESLLVGASNRINPYLTSKEKGERVLYLYLTDSSYELLQERLNTLLSCKPSDVNIFGKELMKIPEDQKNRVVLGNAELINKFNKNNEYKVEILS